MARFATAMAASLTASYSVGCGWQVRAISSAEPPNSIAIVASVIIVPASAKIPLKDAEGWLALLRRPAQLQSLAPAWGDLQVLPDAGRMQCGGESITLAPAELQIMLSLVRAAGQTGDDGTRIRVLAAEPSKDVESVSKCARIRNRGAGCNDAEIVSNDVGDRKGHTRTGSTSGEPAALDRREMFADGIERLDVRPGAQQLSGRRLFVFERHVIRRNGHQR